MYSPVRARSSCPTQNYGSTVKKVKKSENLGLHEILTTLNRFHRMLNFSSDPTTSGHPPNMFTTACVQPDPPTSEL